MPRGIPRDVERFQEWIRCNIPSPVCLKYNIPPGEYLVMLDKGTFLIKDPKQGRIVYSHEMDSILDISLLAPTKQQAEAIQKLGAKAYESGTDEYTNHHIIPHHLWTECQLLVQATNCMWSLKKRW